MPNRTYTIAADSDTVNVLRYSLEKFAGWVADERSTAVLAADDDTSILDIAESTGSGINPDCYRGVESIVTHRYHLRSRCH